MGAELEKYIAMPAEERDTKLAELKKLKEDSARRSSCSRPPRPARRRTAPRTRSKPTPPLRRRFLFVARGTAASVPSSLSLIRGCCRVNEVLPHLLSCRRCALCEA